MATTVGIGSVDLKLLEEYFGDAKSEIPFSADDDRAYEVLLERGDFAARISALATPTAVWIDWRAAARDQDSIQHAGNQVHVNPARFGSKATLNALTDAVSEVMGWSLANHSPFPLPGVGVTLSTDYPITGDSFLLDKESKDPMPPLPYTGELITGPGFSPTPNALLLENGLPLLLEGVGDGIALAVEGL